MSGLNSQSPPYQPQERGKGSEREVIDKEQATDETREYRKSNTLDEAR